MPGKLQGSVAGPGRCVSVGISVSVAVAVGDALGVGVNWVPVAVASAGWVDSSVGGVRRVGMGLDFKSNRFGKSQANSVARNRASTAGAHPSRRKMAGVASLHSAPEPGSDYRPAPHSRKRQRTGKVRAFPKLSLAVETASTKARNRPAPVLSTQSIPHRRTLCSRGFIAGAVFCSLPKYSTVVFAGGFSRSPSLEGRPRPPKRSEVGGRGLGLSARHARASCDSGHSAARAVTRPPCGAPPPAVYAPPA